MSHSIYLRWSTAVAPKGSFPKYPCSAEGEADYNASLDAEWSVLCGTAGVDTAGYSMQSPSFHVYRGLYPIEGVSRSLVWEAAKRLGYMFHGDKQCSVEQADFPVRAMVEYFFT